MPQDGDWGLESKVLGADVSNIWTWDDGVAGAAVG